MTLTYTGYEKATDQGKLTAELGSEIVKRFSKLQTRLNEVQSELDELAWAETDD